MLGPWGAADLGSIPVVFVVIVISHSYGTWQSTVQLTNCQSKDVSPPSDVLRYVMIWTHMFSSPHVYIRLYDNMIYIYAINIVLALGLVG